MYDEKNKSGDVFQVLKYRKRKYANRATFRVEPIDVDNLNEDIDELVASINACILPKDEEKLKMTLQNSVKLRSILLSQNDATYPKMFEFYLVDPKMVIY